MAPHMAVPWVMVAELLPPRHRTTATGMATVLTWGGSFFITQFSLSLLDAWGPVRLFSSFVCVCGFLGAWVWAEKLSGFVETKGRSLDEIQLQLRK